MTLSSDEFSGGELITDWRCGDMNYLRGQFSLGLREGGFVPSDAPCQLEVSMGRRPEAPNLLPIHR